MLWKRCVIAATAERKVFSLMLCRKVTNNVEHCAICYIDDAPIALDLGLPFLPEDSHTDVEVERRQRVTVILEYVV